MRTGSIVDFHDDPHGTILKEKVAHADLPDFIKEAAYLDDEAHASLPDDAFALVAIDGAHKLRKFACADKGNTALSAIYFMETRHKLPEEAQKVAAANLALACEAYGLEAPGGLLKVAGPRWDAVKRFGKSVGESWSGTGESLKSLAKEEGATPTLMTRLKSVKAMPKVVREGVEAGADKADLYGSAVGSGARMLARPAAVAGALGATGYAAGSMASKSPEERRKSLRSAAGRLAGGGGMASAGAALAKSAALQPYVDITGQQPPPRFEKRAHTHFCLIKEGQGRYPIDDYGQVLDANRWFEDHGSSLHPEDRREYCTKLAARADELGIAVTDKVRKYGGEDYASDGEIKVAVSTRMQFWADDSAERDMLKGLMDKYASVTPDVFCESLRQFDEMTGMHHHWDAGIYDPWYSTYGFNKQAEWSWQDGNDHVNAEQLARGAAENRDDLVKRFGEEVASELCKNPQQIFDSLPLDSKRIISRIVTDSH